MVASSATTCAEPPEQGRCWCHCEGPGRLPRTDAQQPANASESVAAARLDGVQWASGLALCIAIQCPACHALPCMLCVEQLQGLILICLCRRTRPKVDRRLKVASQPPDHANCPTQSTSSCSSASGDLGQHHTPQVARGTTHTPSSAEHASAIYSYLLNHSPIRHHPCTDGQRASKPLGQQASQRRRAHPHFSAQVYRKHSAVYLQSSAMPSHC